MLKRNEEGKLCFDNFGFELLIGGLFDKCKNLDELGWLYKEITHLIDEFRPEELEEKMPVQIDMETHRSCGDCRFCTNYRQMDCVRCHAVGDYGRREIPEWSISELYVGSTPEKHQYSLEILKGLGIEVV